MFLGFHPNHHTPIEVRFEASYIPEPNSGCWLWVASCCGKTGRPIITHQKRKQFAYRVAWQLFCGPIPEGMLACHKCDTPQCVNPDHLFMGTRFDNMRDSAAKGRNVSQTSPEKNPFNNPEHRKPAGPGEKHWNCRLTPERVRELRSKKKPGESAKPLAIEFGISETHVFQICTGSRWKHIK